MGFLTYGLLCPFCFPLGILGLFTNFVFSWVFTDFIGLPRPNYFILILGVLWACHQSPTLFACIALGLSRPIPTFFHIIHCPWVCYSLFLSFRALLSPFAFSRPIYLYHGPVILYSCRLDLMVFVLYLLPTSFRSMLLGWASSLFIRVPQKKILNKSHGKCRNKIQRICIYL